MSTITAKQTAPYGPRDAGAILTLDEFEASLADFKSRDKPMKSSATGCGAIKNPIRKASLST